MSLSTQQTINNTVVLFTSDTAGASVAAALLSVSSAAAAVATLSLLDERLVAPGKLPYCRSDWDWLSSLLLSSLVVSVVVAVLLLLLLLSLLSLASSSRLLVAVAYEHITVSKHQIKIIIKTTTIIKIYVALVFQRRRWRPATMLNYVCRISG